MKDWDWEILYTLYKTPNITKAANMLYTSQPSLTKRLKSIEEEFDIKIFLRTSNGIEFTPEGEYLAKKAEQHIEFIKEIKRDLKSQKNKYEGIITVGSSYSYSKYKLVDVLSDFAKQYPSINFDIINDQSNKLYRKILDNDLTLGFICGDYGGNINKILVKQDKAYIVSKESIDMNELPKMQRINYRSNDKSQEILDKWWVNNFKENRPKGMFAGYIDFAWKLVNKGWGYCCCFLQDEFENENNLVMTPLLDDEGNHITRNTWLVYSNKKQLSVVEQKFIEYMKNNIEIK